MLLTLFAIVVGSVIGHLRGGDKDGALGVKLRATPLLVIAIATVLVQAVLNPVFPFVWSLVSLMSFIAFGVFNRHLTGMSVMLVGATLNLLPMLLNGATPVSELALISVGDLTPFGEPDIGGALESSTTATRLSFLGDAIPVPFFGAVVSIGDLIALVGLADVVTNLFLTIRRRELSLEDVGVSFGPPAKPTKVSILSPLQIAGRSASSLAHRRPRLKAAPSSHVPAHAAPDDTVSESTVSESTVSESPAHAALESPLVDSPAPESPAALEPSGFEVFEFDRFDLSEAEQEIDLRELDAEAPEAAPVLDDFEPTVELAPIKLEEPARPSTQDIDPIQLAGLKAVPVTPRADEPVAVAPVYEEVVEVIDLTDPNDPRPIIDLTTSPSDEQMTEFLRRRRAADRELQRVVVRPAGQRRGRAPVRIRTDAHGGVVESTS